MARVTGVGGVFLRSADPKALGAWYAKHLGVEIGDYGATFWWKDEGPKGTGMTTWNPFPMSHGLLADALAVHRTVRRRDALVPLPFVAQMLRGFPATPRERSS